jgi:putative ABC transport system permease protein
VVALWTEAIIDIGTNALRVHADILRQDLRYTLRTVGRAPGFAVTVVAVSALGIGATTASFSITNHVLLRPLPFADPDRLVQLWQDQSYRGYLTMELSPGNYRDWKRMATSFEAMGVYTNRSVNLVGSGEPERLEGAAVTWDLFGVLGIAPARGRTFAEADDRHGAAGTVILSERLWQTYFGGDPTVLGRKLILNDEPHEVVGIMPAGFYFPSRATEFWTPMRFRPDAFDDRTDTYIKPIGRLKPGVTLEQARSEMRLVAAQLERAYPKENARTGAFLHLLKDQVSDTSRLMLVALVAASICVLLIAATNLANLLLARALARQREIAIRVAIGAGTQRLVRQMLTESLLLSAIGGLAGVAVAAAAGPLAARLVPTTLPIGDVPSLDARVLLFAAIVTVLTGIGFGVAPALRLRGSGDSSLRGGARTGTARVTERLRSALVVAEVASCVVLLMCAGLLIAALWRVQSVDPGFRAEGVLTLRTTLPLPKYESTAKRGQFYRQVLSEIGALPGVSRAAFISFLPMVMRGGIWPVTTDGRAPDPSAEHTASLRFVTPGFFESLGIPMRRGRDVHETDTRTAQAVAVVSESFVREHWPGHDPIGRRFQIAFQDRIVVGVAGDVRVRGLERTSEPQVYLPYAQVPDGSLINYTPKDLVIKASSAPAMLLPAVRQIVARADPDLPISSVRSLDEIVQAETGPRRVQVQTLGLFALVAFGLAALGIHGLLAFNVSSRAREIGVRLALGAPRAAVVRMVTGQALRLACIGVGLAVPIGYAAGRQMQSLLAGVSPADVPTVGAAVTIALIMALTGSLVPAARAARVDPLAAIRVES